MDICPIGSLGLKNQINRCLQIRERKRFLKGDATSSYFFGKINLLSLSPIHISNYCSVSQVVGGILPTEDI